MFLFSGTCHSPVVSFSAPVFIRSWERFIQAACRRYFSFVFSATKAFPHYMGVASGTSMAIFGFSPLLLSAVASRYFTSSETGLDVTHFLGFLAIVAGVVHSLSALCMQGAEPRVPSHTNHSPDEDSAPSSSSTNTTIRRTFMEDVDEEQRPLLAPKRPSSDVDVPIFSVPEPLHGTVGDLLSDPYFWVLALVAATVLGTVRDIHLRSIQLADNNPTGRDSHGQLGVHFCLSPWSA